MTQKLKSYKKYLEQKKLQAKTIKIYLWHLEQFLQWQGDKKNTSANYKKYYGYLLKTYPKVATINLRLVILNAWFKFKKINWQFDLLTAEKQNIEVLDKNQLKQFLDAPLKNKSLLGLRDKILLELGYCTGLKVGQLTQTKKSDLNLEKNILKLKKIEASISTTTKFYLLKYLAQRSDENPYLFINFDRAQKGANKHLPISIRSAERILEKYARTMQPILKITPQTLRHTLAYNLKQEGASIAAIQHTLHFATKQAAEEYFKKI
ncbi:tyrosine-type recombinase/integrase [bacterium]|jgi:site-specific recombinase XerD|nr:tyrosine-type recombinase/integrase [bacterium]MBT4649380.1 tyrosine-type recombinase/integrase [bacterium]